MNGGLDECKSRHHNMIFSKVESGYLRNCWYRLSFGVKDTSPHPRTVPYIVRFQIPCWEGFPPKTVFFNVFIFKFQTVLTLWSIFFWRSFSTQMTFLIYRQPGLLIQKICRGDDGNVSKDRYWTNLMIFCTEIFQTLSSGQFPPKTVFFKVLFLNITSVGASYEWWVGWV